MEIDASMPGKSTPVGLVRYLRYTTFLRRKLMQAHVIAAIEDVLFASSFYSKLLTKKAVIFENSLTDAEFYEYNIIVSNTQIVSDKSSEAMALCQRALTEPGMRAFPLRIALQGVHDGTWFLHVRGYGGGDDERYTTFAQPH
jgi:hypothetical protein